ncbi:MAG: prepilin peptidase [Helicobacter sp.]|nr:prepilin peptidase [Helicobacter sp.]
MEWLLVGIIGLCMGSFVAVLFVRIPQSQSLLTRSRCPLCGTQLRFYHLVPLLSFAFLRGKCAFCHANISPLYPVLELFGMGISLALFWRFGASREYIVLLALFAVLFAASLIDWQHECVSGTLLFCGLGIAYAYLLYVDSVYAILHSLDVVGVVALLAVALYALTGRKSIGDGDIVSIALSSAILGTQYNYLALFLASGMALLSLLSVQRQKIAFIPFLSIATFMVLFWIS